MLKPMETSSPFLPPEIEAAVEAQHGGPVSVPGQHGKYVVMNVDVYGGVLEASVNGGGFVGVTNALVGGSANTEAPRAPARARLSLLPSGPGEIHELSATRGARVNFTRVCPEPGLGYPGARRIRLEA